MAVSPVPTTTPLRSFVAAMVDAVSNSEDPYETPEFALICEGVAGLADGDYSGASLGSIAGKHNYLVVEHDCGTGVWVDGHNSYGVRAKWASRPMFSVNTGRVSFVSVD